jgi:hypothetical protein
MSMAHMTTYEASEIISLRSILLSKGAATLLSDAERMHVADHISMATLELALGYIDAKVYRPDNVYRANCMVLPRCVTDMCCIPAPSLHAGLHGSSTTTL